jgi:hypothetical protein
MSHQRPRESCLRPLRLQVPLPPLFDHKSMRQRQLPLLPTDGEDQAHRYDYQEDYDRNLRRSKRLGTTSVAKMPEYLDDQHAYPTDSESLPHVLTATGYAQGALPEVLIQNFSICSSTTNIARRYSAANYYLIINPSNTYQYLSTSINIYQYRNQRNSRPSRMRRVVHTLAGICDHQRRPSRMRRVVHTLAGICDHQRRPSRMRRVVHTLAGICDHQKQIFIYRRFIIIL